MKILYISHHSKMYGANRALLNLILELKEKHNIEAIVMCMAEGEFVKSLVENNIAYIKIKCYQWHDLKENLENPIRKIYHNFMNFFYYRRILEYCEGLNVDLIHSNSSATNVGQYLADNLMCPHIWHIREFGYEDYNMIYSVTKHRIRKQYRKAKLVAISKSVYDKYHDMVPEADIEVIYDGVNKPSFKKEKICNGNVQFCCVGLISMKKNQLVVLKAAKILLDRNQKEFCIHFIGDGSDDYINELMAYTKENNLSKYVVFHGYSKDVEKCLHEMHVGIIPSQKEAFGLVTVEYMFSCMPIIGSNTGATSELVEHGNNGLIFNSDDDISLANAMEYFIQDKKKITMMGSEGFIYAAKRFTTQINAETIYNKYRQLIMK